jgi:Cu(I)/Ag(I) efflux system membrane fusion protein/cobalt-zinc-cadmium efflux system membrane fusion protein
VDSEAQLQSAMSGYIPASQQAANASQQATEQLQIDFTTQPSPPRKGTNTILVKVIGTGGRPVTGVQAIVTFFMPAMPAMGMAAQRASASLTERGNGNYEGSMQLDSGGTWQATVSVQRGGKTIATKALSLNVAGGM